MQIDNCVGERHHLTSIIWLRSPAPKPELLLQAVPDGAEVDLRGRAGVIRNQRVKQMFN